MDDDPLKQYYYLLALGFWLEFFKNNHIDMVFISSLEHGGFFDSIPLDIAKNKNIPTFSSSFISGIGKYYIHFIMEYNDRKFLDISKLDTTKINLKDYNNIITNFINKTKTFSYFFRRKLPFYYHTKIRPLLGLITFRMAYSKYLFLKKRNMEKITTRDLFFKPFHIKRLKKVYDKISKKPEMENYVYFH